MVINARDAGSDAETGSGDAFLRTALAALKDGILVLSPIRDTDGVIVDERIEYTNPAWRRHVLGSADATDPAGSRLLEAIPAFAERLDAHRHVIETGEERRDTVTAPGTARDHWFEADMRRAGDGLVVLVRDVTDERLAREARDRSDEAGRLREDGLRSRAEAAERASLAMTHAAVGMAILDPDGAFLYVNEALCRITGRDAESLMGSRWQDITHPDDIERSQAVAGAIRDGRQDSERITKRYVRLDGTVIWCDLSVASVRDASGTVTCIVSQVLDVTDRIEAEAALRASEERYRTLVSEIDGVVFVHDTLGGMTFCSGQVVDLLGFPPETMVLPGVWRSLVVEEDVEHEFDMEYRMRRADGKVIWVEERWRAIRDAAGRLVRWSAVVTDVTGRRRLEETLARTDRLEAVSRVAASAAHDFGDVLTAIQYAHGNLADSVDGDDPRVEDVRAIGDAVRHGIQLTKQLLAFGRDRDEAEAAPLDVAWLLADLEQILRGVAGTADLGIRVAANGLTRITRSALEQAILNLVINARDAMPTGGSIRISVDRELVPPDSGLGIPAGPYLALAVEDTGCGMPDEVREKAFEPFFTTKPHGSGIGLPSVYGTMRSVGGTVRIASLAGEGTTIWLLMPEAEAAAASTLIV
jgi:PAS domain S-box-containing protein